MAATTGEEISIYKSIDGTMHALKDQVARDRLDSLAESSFTPAEKTKLDGIADSADENVIESVSVDGKALTPDAKKNVNLDLASVYAKLADFTVLSNDQVDSMVATAFSST